MGKAVNQFIGQIRKYVQICKPKELELQSGITDHGLEEDQNRKALHQPRRAMHVVCVPSMNDIFITAES